MAEIVLFISLRRWAMRDFNFWAQQPLLAVFRCLLFSIYWLEAPRKYGFGTSNKRLGLLALYPYNGGQSFFLLAYIVNVLKWWCILRLTGLFWCLGLCLCKDQCTGTPIWEVKSVSYAELIPWVDNSLGCWWENALIQTEFPLLPWNMEKA